MIYRGVITGDLNKKIQPGIYTIQSGSTVQNAPDGTGWSAFIQLPDVYQTQIVYIQTKGVLHRKYAGSPANWTTWI